jgi:hypothetical protein
MIGSARQALMIANCKHINRKNNDLKKSASSVGLEITIGHVLVMFITHIGWDPRVDTMWTWCNKRVSEV